MAMAKGAWGDYYIAHPIEHLNGLANHIRFIAEYEDGSGDVFAVPECSLQPESGTDAYCQNRRPRTAGRWILEVG